jgi:hypothetical protein
MSALGFVGLAINFRACDFVSQELRAVRDPEFDTVYTKNQLLNEGIRAWMSANDQLMKPSGLPRYFFQGEMHFKKMINK